MADGKKKMTFQKKKKKKTNKKTKREKKEKEELERAAKKIYQNENSMEEFVTKVNKWLSQNLPNIFQLFDAFDSNGTGLLSYKQFKTVMVESEIPCNKGELHLLTQILDEEKRNLIDYQKLSAGVMQDSSSEFRQEFGFCQNCGMGTKNNFESENHFFKPKIKRYVQVELRTATFNQIQNHHGHFFIVVLADTLIQFLINQILIFTQIATTRMALFKDITCNAYSLLPEDKTLEECGFLGFCKTHPQEIVLFYDFRVDFTECPLLMDDHYFGK